MHVSHKYAPEQKIAPLGIKGNRKNNSDIVFFLLSKVSKGKAGCVFPMVNSSEFRIGQYRDDVDDFSTADFISTADF